MPITYTNRKGVTYYLCKGVTKSGKTRYFAARKPRGDVVEEMPEGLEFTENVNGLVAIGRQRQSQIMPEELAAIEAVVRRHLRAHRYRVVDKRDHIEIYEADGPDAEELLGVFARRGFGMPGMARGLQAHLDSSAQFSPVLRFILENAEQRTFGVERMCYRSGVNGWLPLRSTGGSIYRIAREVIPTLGTDEFFELW